MDFLGFSDALDKARYAETNVGGLSALAYDAAHGVYYSLVDNDRDTPARLYTLRLPLDGGKLGTPEVLAVTTLRNASGQPFTGRNFDGEGMALLPDGNLLISSETEPSIRRFAPDGRLLAELPVPPRFLVKPNGEATDNLTFESLALTPDSGALYTMNEGPLAPDGLSALSARLRILRYDRQSDGGFTPAAQFFYLADPAEGVSDMVALSATDLLVLERGFIPGAGNTIRIYRVSLAGAPDVTGRASLADADLKPLPKTLLADLTDCPPSGARNPAKQSNPLLDNIESLAFGPRLPDGRQTLLLQSDDNFGRDQVTRVLALAFRP